MPSDPPYSYAGQYNTADETSQPEHAYIHLTDANDGANATANYYITWHDPVEGWFAAGMSQEVQPVLYGSSETDQPAGGQVNVSVSSGQVDWSVPEKAGGGVLTTAAAFIAVAQPETDPIIIALLTAGGYKLSVADPPAPVLYAISGSETQFEQDVATQEQINSGNAGSVFEPGINRFEPPSLADTVYNSGDDYGSWQGADGHSYTFGVQIYRHEFFQNYLGDSYGINGFTGQIAGSITTPGALEYVYTWN